jgi:hypothetical protein
MSRGPFDPRAIPVLTDAVDDGMFTVAPPDIAAMRADLLNATLDLVDSLLHEATRDIESLLFERVLDRLHAQLPDLVERVLREHLPADPGSAAAEEGPMTIDRHED